MQAHFIDEEMETQRSNICVLSHTAQWVGSVDWDHLLQVLH